MDKINDFAEINDVPPNTNQYVDNIDIHKGDISERDDVFIPHKPKEKFNAKIIVLIVLFVLTIVDIIVPDPLPFMDELILLILDSKMLYDICKDADMRIETATGMHISTYDMTRGVVNDLKDGELTRNSVHNAMQKNVVDITKESAKQMLDEKLNR